MSFLHPNKAAPFKRVNEQVEGRWLHFHVGVCGRCCFESKIIDATSGGMPPQMVATKLRQRGWQVAANRADDLCPNCIAQSKNREAPMKTPSPITRPPTTADMRADPPRQPTPADRRRIADKLEEHYDTKRGLYLQSWSDTALASKIEVPAAWVTDVRQMLFGAGDGNEAAQVREASIAALEAKLKALTDDFTERMADVERDLSRLKLDRSYAA